MATSYDVIIIGTGPAGIFAALELVKKSGLKVLMIEKGSDIEQRACPMIASDSHCVQCGLCSILCGWGGAGAYSDGKLTLTPEFGGWLKDYLSAEDLSLFIDYVDSVYLSFGAGGARPWRGPCGPVPSQEKSRRIQPRTHPCAHQAYRHRPLQGSP